METSLETIGTLEYVLDKYSKIWSWKISGDRAVSMISRLVPEAWYGENVNEVIISDSTENIKQIKLIMDRYPLEILSKYVWQRKIIKTYLPRCLQHDHLVFRFQSNSMQRQYFSDRFCGAYLLLVCELQDSNQVLQR